MCINFTPPRLLIVVSQPIRFPLRPAGVILDNGLAAIPAERIYGLVVAVEPSTAVYQPQSRANRRRE